MRWPKLVPSSATEELALRVKTDFVRDGRSPSVRRFVAAARSAFGLRVSGGCAGRNEFQFRYGCVVAPSGECCSSWLTLIGKAGVSVPA
jgi:hypothetical protein